MTILHIEEKVVVRAADEMTAAHAYMSSKTEDGELASFDYTGGSEFWSKSLPRRTVIVVPMCGSLFEVTMVVED